VEDVADFPHGDDDRPERRRLVRVAAARPPPQGDRDRACAGRGHVLLEDLGVQSAQRLGIGDVGGNVVVALWPAELKEQAKYLYGGRLGRPMIAAARERGWTAEPSPHLAFRNASPTVRLYMAPHLAAAEYARRWEEGDLERVGADARADVVRDLWPWLKSRGYATDSDDRVLEEWLDTRLGNRPALLRSGLRLKRTWPGNALASPREASELAEEIRSDVDAIPRCRAGACPPRDAAVGRKLLGVRSLRSRRLSFVRMTTSPARRSVVAYAALTGLLDLAVLLPGNPHYSSAWGLIGAVAIQTLIVWRLWHGSPLAWLVALAFAAFTVVTVPLMDPGLEVGVVLFFVLSTAQAVVLCARPLRASVWREGSSGTTGPEHAPS
jgi:hypothetical protein